MSMSEEQCAVDRDQTEPPSAELPALETNVGRLDAVEAQPERALPLYQDISAALDDALHGSDERPSP
jgi:hypothetical protein